MLVEHVGTDASFLLAGVAGLIVATAVWARRNTLAAAPATGSEPVPAVVDALSTPVSFAH